MGLGALADRAEAGGALAGVWWEGSCRLWVRLLAPQQGAGEMFLPAPKKIFPKHCAGG